MLSLEDIKQDRYGIYYVRKYLGLNALTKKPMRPYKRFPRAASAEEAFEEAQAWYNTIAVAADMHAAQRLDDLLDRYIGMLVAANASPNTIKTYRSCKARYVAPYLGASDPKDIKPYTIDGLYGMLAMQGARRGGGISPNTIIKLHWFLCGAFKWFVREGICEVNPMLAVRKPEPDTAEALALNEGEHARIQQAIYEVLGEPAEGAEAIFRKNAAFAAHLSLNTGARCGEVCACNRSDAQLFRQIMHVSANAVESDGSVWRREKTKGKRMRNVSLDAQLCREIEQHYEWQRSYLSAAQQRSERTPICTTSQGAIMRPSKVSQAFSEMARELALPRGVSFHTLRHTHATWLLMDGEDMRAIQERLGHASVATTLRVYSHVMPGRDQAAADRFGARRAMLGGRGI